MFLQSAEIQNFRGIRHLKVDFEQDSTVLLGENAWGKSSLLYALFTILGRGEEHLCSFSADDLYIPIRLDNDQDAVKEQQSAATATALKAPASASTPDAGAGAVNATAGTVRQGLLQSDSELYLQADQKNLLSSPSMRQASLSQIKARSISKFLQDQGLLGVEPLKIINTKDYQRRYYRVPKGDGTYAVHIIDLPLNIEDAQDSINAALKQQKSAGAGSGSDQDAASTKGTQESGSASSSGAHIARPQVYLDALSSFLAPQQQLLTPLNESSGDLRWQHLSSAPLKSLALRADGTADAGSSSDTDAGTGSGSDFDEYDEQDTGSSLDQSAVFAALRRGQAAEAQYEREQPLHYVPSRSELMQRAQNVLLGRGLLEQEAIESAQDDVAFYQSDVFTSKVERIVIDLIFCESSYGVVNKIERFAPLRPACYLGEDGLYRIHYRISAFMQESKELNGQKSFITQHELLNARSEAIDNAHSIIRELIILNPLLRLRDRRMLKPHLDPLENLEPASFAPERAGAGSLAGAGAGALAGATSSAGGGECEFVHKVQGAGAASAAAPEGAAAAAPAAKQAVGTAHLVDEQDLQAISHLFTDIALDDDFTSRQVKDGIEVLNTIASKYLINYQSNNLSTAYHNYPSPDGSKRTTRDIITHPVSIASLRSLQQALSDNKPSRAKFLLSLLAGALLMSRGQRQIDEYSRPILILEDIEARFHPTLLLNLWAILQLLPIQKIVTTNSAQLLSAVPMSKLRRLCKQYYDVRCYSMRDRAFSEDDARKIAFHIRMSRPSTLFARCWILVEGETEVWILNEIANTLDFNLACGGVAVVEFAQCGLNPLIKLAKQLGIAYHVLTDGDDAGRRYAQVVCDFVGSENLPDHLSVMPQVDIEHYMYTSGFADVYQKAAGLTLNTPKYRAMNGSVQRKSLNDNEATVSASAHNKLDRVIISGSKEKEKEIASPRPAHDAAPAASAQVAVVPYEELLRRIHINTKDYKLKNHQLPSVIKAIMHYNLGHRRDILEKALSRGKILAKSKKVPLLNKNEISQADIESFYNHAYELVNSMPRPKRAFTKRQQQIVAGLKSERSLWMKVVGQNQKRLNNQLQQAKEAAQREADRQYYEQMEAIWAMQKKLAKGKGAESAAAAAAESVDQMQRPALDFKEEGESTTKQDARESAGAGAASDAGAGSSAEEKLNANDLYGALNQKELSRQGMSISKVIDKAIHKKTKPGMAVLVSEAILQRGPSSVPQLFATLFCKVKRLAQSEVPFD